MSDWPHKERMDFLKRSLAACAENTRSDYAPRIGPSDAADILSAIEYAEAFIVTYRPDGSPVFEGIA